MWSVILIITFLLFITVVTWLSYYLGKTKTQNPVPTAVIGFFLSLIPPLGLIYLVILSLKEEVGIV